MSRSHSYSVVLFAVMLAGGVFLACGSDEADEGTGGGGSSGSGGSTAGTGGGTSGTGGGTSGTGGGSAGTSGTGGSAGTSGTGGSAGTSGTGGGTAGTGGGTAGSGGGSAGTAGSGGGTGGSAGAPIGTGDSTTETIGANGGTIALEGVTVTVPAGAVSADTSFKITSLTTTADLTNGEALTPVYKFEPEGITFAQPLTVTMTIPGAPSDAVIAWTEQWGVTFQPVASTVAGTEVSGSVTHFCCGMGLGGCATTCAGSAPMDCAPASAAPQ